MPSILVGGGVAQKGNPEIGQFASRVIRYISIYVKWCEWGDGGCWCYRLCQGLSPIKEAEKDEGGEGGRGNILNVQGGISTQSNSAMETDTPSIS